MARSARRTGRAGYTLIELLIAGALAAVLILLAAAVFSSGMKARDRMRAFTADEAALRRAYETMSRDFHSSVVPPDDSAVTFGLAASPAGAGTDVLQFASTIGEPLLAGRITNETVLVQYAIAPDPRTERPTLWRYTVPYPVEDPSDPASSGDTRTMPLLPGVSSASYAFYSTSQATWIPSWDGETGLPTAVRVDLMIDPPDGKGNPTVEAWVFTMPAAKFANEEAAAAAETAAGAAAGTAGGQ